MLDCAFSHTHIALTILADIGNWKKCTLVCLMKVLKHPKSCLLSKAVQSGKSRSRGLAISYLREGFKNKNKFCYCRNRRRALWRKHSILLEKWIKQYKLGRIRQVAILNSPVVTSWRTESSNISLVVLDKLLYYSRNLVFFIFQNFWRPTDRPTDQPTNRPTDRPTVRPTLLPIELLSQLKRNQIFKRDVLSQNQD